MRVLVLLSIAALAGCTAAMPDTSGFVEAEPRPAPHPGIYTGSLSNGILTYKIQADGTGRSCFRDNYNQGKMMYSDLKYDGQAFHTEGGTFKVDEYTEERIEMHYGMIDAELLRKEQAPTNCRDFFAK